MKKTMTMTTKTHLILSLSLLMGACTPDEPTSTTEGVQDDIMSCEVRQKTDGTHLLICGDEELPLPFSGPQGEDGQDGADGEAGMDGQNGADGQDGINGKDGQDGADGQSVYVTRTRLEKGDDTCPEGGERIELFEGMTDDTPDASFEVCDVVCSEGEVFDPFFGQCIKMVTIHFEGSAWSTMGDIPADFAPTDPIETDALGIDGTPCSGTLRYPFMQDAEFKDDFMALYDFGRFSVTGLEMTLGDKTYTRDPGITGDSISTMYREIYPFGGQGQLNVEVRQTELRDAPVGYQAALVLRGGDESLPYDEAERLLPSPDRAEDWSLLQDESVETISLEVVDEVTELTSLVRCRIHRFE